MMKKVLEQIVYDSVDLPRQYWPEEPVSLTNQTMERRKKMVLAVMEQWGLEVLCIYADREHGGNFGYLTGFEPRFEEAVLVLHRDGKAFLLLGNESLRMGDYCRIQNTVIHVPHFSLPNQPMETKFCLTELFEQAGLVRGMTTGIVGWKLFTSKLEDNWQMYEVPFCIVDSIREIVGEKVICNAGGLFINPSTGVRVINNANEIAHFEYGATLASDCVLRAMDEIAVGKTELEIADFLGTCGQPTSVQTICATGERFTNAEVAPRKKEISLGDTFSITMGLRGGLTSRTGYIAADRKDMPEAVADYMERLAVPYFAAACKWYETVGIGIEGDTLYRVIEEIIPKAEYRWMLNPGHLISSEEWLASPVEKGSDIILKSGMMLQMDIIPRLAGYGGANAEDGIVLADKELQDELSREYPSMWQRMCERKCYMREKLGILLKDEVFPLSDVAGYYRPWLLKKTHVLRKKELS